MRRTRFWALLFAGYYQYNLLHAHKQYIPRSCKQIDLSSPNKADTNHRSEHHLFLFLFALFYSKMGVNLEKAREGRLDLSSTLPPSPSHHVEPGNHNTRADGNDQSGRLAPHTLCTICRHTNSTPLRFLPPWCQNPHNLNTTRTAPRIAGMQAVVQHIRTCPHAVIVFSFPSSPTSTILVHSSPLPSHLSPRSCVAA